jgi:hypothetical protein
MRPVAMRLVTLRLVIMRSVIMAPVIIGTVRSRVRPVPLLLALSGWLVLGLVTAGAAAWLRVPAVFGFSLVCPGAALVRLLRLTDPLERAVLTIALGLSLAALTAETGAIGHTPRPGVVLAVLASVCSAAALAEMVRQART